MQAKIYKFPPPESARRIARIKKMIAAEKLVMVKASAVHVPQKVRDYAAAQAGQDKKAAEKAARINRLEYIFCKYYRDPNTTFKSKEEPCEKNL